MPKQIHSPPSFAGSADSWYCRIAAADLVARLAADAAGQAALQPLAADAAAALLQMLRLPHSRKVRRQHLSVLPMCDVLREAPHEHVRMAGGWRSTGSKCCSCTCGRVCMD